ncbi:hypothetical protein Scep_017567 [Stephania cephalantha]|uniref:Uncharacterized protein n=1 Tax=Stephania cephalantha TaxID=152367 RepID=A0AAP0IPP1_9MAGN
MHRTLVHVEKRGVVGVGDLQGFQRSVERDLRKDSTHQSLGNQTFIPSHGFHAFGESMQV